MLKETQSKLPEEVAAFILDNYEKEDILDLLINKMSEQDITYWIKLRQLYEQLCNADNEQERNRIQELINDHEETN